MRVRKRFNFYDEDFTVINFLAKRRHNTIDVIGYTVITVAMSKEYYLAVILTVFVSAIVSASFEYFSENG
jgi:hypothetical protein